MEPLLKTTNSLIVVCNCKDVPTHAEQAFRLLFPDATVPKTITKSALQTVITKYRNTDLGNYLEAVSRNRERFAYYFEYTQFGEIIKQYDLLKGVRVL